MFDREPPSWRVDVKWIAGLLLVIAVAVLVPLFSLTQLTERENAVPLLERILELTILPTGEEDLEGSVRQDAGYQPGADLELLPGVGVSASAQEIGSLEPVAGARRIAATITRELLDEGAPAVLERTEGTLLEPQIETALEGSARQLVASALVIEMLPAGLETGSRMANWPLQAAQNPGQEVQPIVGLFVTLPPEQLQGLSPRDIGVLAVEELAQVVMDQGAASAAELVTNQNLRDRFTSAMQGPVPQRLEELFGTLLLSFEPLIADRLAQAQAVVAADGVEDEPLTMGVVTPEEIAGLNREEANTLVVRRLAERSYAGGSAALLEVVSASDQAHRLQGAAPLVDGLSARANARYMRWTWITGAAALLFLVVLIVASRGWGRLANPGIALALAAAGGALLSYRLSELTTAATVEAPASLAGQGVFAFLVQLLAFISTSLPQAGIELVVRNHLVVLGAGALLVVLSLLLRLTQLFRPRRRSLL